MVECEYCEDGDNLVDGHECFHCGGKNYKFQIHWSTTIFSTDKGDAHKEAQEQLDSATDMGFVELEEVEK